MSMTYHYVNFQQGVHLRCVTPAVPVDDLVACLRMFTF